MRALLLIPVVLLLFVGGASAESPTLFGTIGPGFVIRLADSAGNLVKHLDPGTYTIQVEDKDPAHNFHLTGPGVDKATDIEEKGTFTWTVTFANGVYRYQCDAHAASVGPGAKITIGRLGVQINTIAAGPVEITVNDRSAKDNFRLSGPGVNRATSKPGKGTSVWKLTLKPGTYVYRSDATPKLRGTFRAV